MFLEGCHISVWPVEVPLAVGVVERIEVEAVAPCVRETSVAGDTYTVGQVGQRIRFVHDPLVVQFKERVDIVPVPLYIAAD